MTVSCGGPRPRILKVKFGRNPLAVGFMRKWSFVKASDSKCFFGLAYDFEQIVW
jgi:hypothetical protein